LLWLQYRDQAPAPRRHGVLYRSLALLVALLAIHTNRQQQGDHFRLVVRRQACQRQRVAALRVAHQNIQPRLLGQMLQHGDVAIVGSFQQRRHAGSVTGIAVGSGGKQGFDDFAIADLASQHQCTTLVCVAGINFCLVAQQQAHPGGIVITSAGSVQCRVTGIGRWRCAALQQQPRDSPVRHGAGHGQRGLTFVIEHIECSSRIEQRRHHTRIAGACRVMQWRVAVAISNARVCAIGKQHAYRIEPPLPTVARRRKQRAEPGMQAIDVDAAFEQGTQNAKIWKQRGKHRQRALIGRVIRWQGMHIGAGRNQGQRVFTLAIAYRAIKRLRIAWVAG